METILYDNYNINYTEWYNEFKDYCEYNGLDITQYSNDSNKFYEWVGESLMMDWDDLLANIKHSKSNQPCVVIGTCGFWYGNRDIEPMKFTSLVDALNGCLGRGDYYIIVKKINGHLEVTINHHDGSHNFEIYLLNEKGNRAGKKANLGNKCYHKAMDKYLF